MPAPRRAVPYHTRKVGPVFRRPSRATSQDTPEATADRVAGYRAEGYRRFPLSQTSPEGPADERTASGFRPEYGDSQAAQDSSMKALAVFQRLADADPTRARGLA
jgi:hypothetical protein